MRNVSLIAIVFLFCIGFFLNGCATLSNPGRADRPPEAVSTKVDNGALVVDLVWCLGSWVLIPGSAGNILGFAGLGGTIYDFATKNIYETKPNYQKKYPDKQK
jgi:hypothetical protein